jgi:hypothetical protein
MFAANGFVVCGSEAAPPGAGDVDLRSGVSGAMLTLSHLDITGDKSRAESQYRAASIINTAKSRHVPLPRVSVSFGS